MAQRRRTTSSTSRSIVNPLPLPDLVVSNVVAPDQVIAGSTFNVTYTVTNLGAGPTLVEYLDRLGLADARQDAADPGQGRHPADRVHAHRQPRRQGRLRPDRQRHAARAISTRAPTTSRPGPTCSRPSCRTRWRSTSIPTTPTTSTATTTRRGRSASWRRCPTWSSPRSTPRTQAHGGDNDHGLLDRAEHRHRRRPAGRLDRHGLPDQRPRPTRSTRTPSPSPWARSSTTRAQPRATPTTPA